MCLKRAQFCTHQEQEELRRVDEAHMSTLCTDSLSFFQAKQVVITHKVLKSALSRPLSFLYHSMSDQHAFLVHLKSGEGVCAPVSVMVIEWAHLSVLST